jgi:hypothetical protein
MELGEWRFGLWLWTKYCTRRWFSYESFDLLMISIIRGLLIQIGMQLPAAAQAKIEHINLSELTDYAAGRVFARTTLVELEEHLFLCGECRSVVVKLDSDASSRRRPLEITHTTADGLIQLWIEQSLSGRWLARFSGDQLDGGQEFGNLESARTFALQSFEQMFPEHVCNLACSFSR